jgi:hypothetical protein
LRRELDDRQADGLDGWLTAAGQPLNNPPVAVDAARPAKIVCPPILVHDDGEQ